MKGSKNTSARATTESAAQSRSGNGSRHSSPGEWFALTGVSDPPDPATHAYRKDLADIGLAGRVIASHYAEPLLRHIVADRPFLAQPSDSAERIGQLAKGDVIRMLDTTGGWAWGYDPDGRVGYVSADAVAP